MIFLQRHINVVARSWRYTIYMALYKRHVEGWAQDYNNSNILFRVNLDPFVNNANLGAIAHTSNGT